MKQNTGHFCLFKFIHVHGFRLVHVNSVEYEQIFRLNSKNVGKILVRVVIYIVGLQNFGWDQKEESRTAIFKILVRSLFIAKICIMLS